jgi:hypothetical protein
MPITNDDIPATNRPFPSDRFDIPINNIKQGVRSIERQYNSEFLNSMHIILCLFVCLLDGV